MNWIDVLILLFVAGLCGSIARALVGFSRGGCLVSIAVGFIGALLGSRLATVLHLPDLFIVEVGGSSLPVLWSIIGGALFTAVLQLITRPWRPGPP
jgi:uncharacterized membrane protein YeaQ/YmgE (transglycosylase-associated protein family)